MKMAEKEAERLIWEHVRSPKSATAINAPHSRTLHKHLFLLIFFVSLTYIIYTLKLISTSRACTNHRENNPFATHTHALVSFTTNATATDLRGETQEETGESPTELNHVVFGIAVSAKLWEQRKNYIKLWYRKSEMRGMVWLDSKVKARVGDGVLPLVRISGDTSRFSYTKLQIA